MNAVRVRPRRSFVCAPRMFRVVVIAATRNVDLSAARRKPPRRRDAKQPRRRAVMSSAARRLCRPPSACQNMRNAKRDTPSNRVDCNVARHNHTSNQTRQTFALPPRPQQPTLNKRVHVVVADNKCSVRYRVQTARNA